MLPSRAVLVGLCVVSVLTWALPTTGLAAAPTFPPGVVTMLGDRASDGTIPNDHTGAPSLSEDGNRVAFVSEANNLVSGDTNNSYDVFMHDFEVGTTERVSLSDNGTQGDDDSPPPGLALGGVAISADGRFVAFVSDADNLVSGDTNAHRDVFERDLVSDTTTRVSVASDGAQSNGDSFDISISDDGRYVGFVSSATNLTGEGVASGYYVHDSQTGTTVLATVTSNGTPVAPETPMVLSGDGHHVAFDATVSGVVPGDTNGHSDVFVHNLSTGTTTRVSVTSKGKQLTTDDDETQLSYDPAISENGRYVAFTSSALNLMPQNYEDTGVFVHDSKTGKTMRVDGLGAESGHASISRGGRYVGFYADGLAFPCAGSSTYYVRDTTEGITYREATDAGGLPVAPAAGEASLSGDGSLLAFESSYPLEPDDLNNRADVFVHATRAPVGAPNAVISLGKREAGERSCTPTPDYLDRVGVLGQPGRNYVFTLTLTNLSPFPDTLSIHGEGEASGFKVSYFRGTTDVTESVKDGTRRTAVLAPGASRIYTMKVHVGPGAPGGSAVNVLISCSSGATPTVVAAVLGRVTASG
jgi:Tol biopolymer transport system component